MATALLPFDENTVNLEIKKQQRSEPELPQSDAAPRLFLLEDFKRPAPSIKRGVRPHRPSRTKPRNRFQFTLVATCLLFSVVAIHYLATPVAPAKKRDVVVLSGKKIAPIAKLKTVKKHTHP